MNKLDIYNQPGNITCGGISHVGISYHSLMYAYLKLTFQPGTQDADTTCLYITKFKYFKKDLFRSDISTQQWEALTNIGIGDWLILEIHRLFLSL